MLFEVLRDGMNAWHREFGCRLRPHARAATVVPP